LGQKIGFLPQRLDLRPQQFQGKHLACALL
jgi:hypothetical protein